jgi:subtilisin family serine protease
MDTGINSAHTEFTGRIGNGRDFVDNDDDPEDCTFLLPGPCPRSFSSRISKVRNLSN